MKFAFAEIRKYLCACGTCGQTGEVVGVTELCNKKGGGPFTRCDEQIAQAFSVYCSMSVIHVSECKQQQSQQSQSVTVCQLLLQCVDSQTFRTQRFMLEVVLADRDWTTEIKFSGVADSVCHLLVSCFNCSTV